MKETQLLGKLMPGHPDVIPIVKNIREKYQIPEVRPEDDIYAILLTRDDIDWEAVRQDIEAQVRNVKFHSDKEEAYLETLRKLQNTSLDFPELAPLSYETMEALKKLISGILQYYLVILTVVEEKTVCRQNIWDRSSSLLRCGFPVNENYTAVVCKFCKRLC